MKILYGVQGTGNGHLTRSRVMAKHFAAAGADVSYVFSGRDQHKYFDMEAFGDNCRYYRGLTFTTVAGKVRYFKTVVDNNIFQLLKDIRALDVSAYDLVITDFEPVSAWAGKLANKPVLGVGHQFAFDHDIPTVGANPAAKLVMKYFAPVKTGLGLHWHHFNQPILPPIVDEMATATHKQANKVVVYLPFEDRQQVMALLKQLPEYRFYLYAPNVEDGDEFNVRLRKTCLEGFQRDLHDASAVICNAGFELVSECLQLGTPVLVKPLAGQMEQLSNAAALKQLGFGDSMEELDLNTINHWLASKPRVDAQGYPNVAAAIVDWILSGQLGGRQALAKQLWQNAL
jgi:uncharacterized protein (TIGR00661 family)